MSTYQERKAKAIAEQREMERQMYRPTERLRFFLLASRTIAGARPLCPSVMEHGAAGEPGRWS